MLHLANATGRSMTEVQKFADQANPSRAHLLRRQARSLRQPLLVAVIPLFAVHFAIAQSQPGRTVSPPPQVFRAQDTLDVGAEPNTDARECLRGLIWRPTAFNVRLARGNKNGEFVVSFPSPRPEGNVINDRVTVEWYQARERKGAKIDRARPVIVVHELGSNMAAGRAVARAFSKIGLHAFMVQLPSYGHRRVRRIRPAEMLQPMKQAIADVRRARDAIAVLPGVDTSHIALQGTSLGGIVAASSGSLDKGFDSVHLLLAGGDLFDVIKNGDRDTAHVRRDLERAGVTDAQIRSMTYQIEPNRIAHRLNPTRTWLYSAKHDLVIPKANSDALARAARLPEPHHEKFNANHYSGLILMPWIVAKMAGNIQHLAQ